MAKNTNLNYNNILKNTNSDDVINILKSLINKGDNVSLDIVIDVYKNVNNKNLEKLIFELFIIVNDKKFAKKMISLLDYNFEQQKKVKLISFFWQSKMNFIDYLDKFIFLTNTNVIEYLIELFTVIERIIDENEINNKKLDDFANQIKTYIHGKEKPVQLLLAQLVNVVLRNNL